MHCRIGIFIQLHLQINVKKMVKWNTEFWSKSMSPNIISVINSVAKDMPFLLIFKMTLYDRISKKYMVAKAFLYTCIYLVDKGLTFYSDLIMTKKKRTIAKSQSKYRVRMLLLPPTTKSYRYILKRIIRYIYGAFYAFSE